MTDTSLDVGRLPVGSIGRRSTGWFGVWCVIATEAPIFAYLIFSYAYLGTQSVTAWPPGGPPGLTLALPNTIVLLASSGTLALADRAARRGTGPMTLVWLLLTLLLGAAFAVVQLMEWRGKDFGLTDGAYGSIFYTLTGFHLAHVLVGLVVLALLSIWTALGYFDPKRHAAITIGGAYWHFVDAVWIFVFSTLYLTPRLG